MCCAATADFVQVSESLYPMCSVCNQTKEPIKEDSELSHLFCGCVFLHCNLFILFLKRGLFCACVFLQSICICTPTKTSSYTIQFKSNDQR